ncbi:helix-turn-helix transcriptional regulator [Bacillus sp. OV322]|nr:helix-turn-helix transcriptional regulator [Bacillus sp. OV322]
MVITITIEKNMFPGEVASAAFIDRSYYSQIESGKRIQAQKSPKD